MNPTHRIILNTSAQYGRTIFNAILSLYTTRLVLKALGMADFGIYALVGGVVALLGFITNALTITTQRYLSYYQGKEDQNYVCKIFSNSLMIHLCIGLAISAILLAIEPLLFSQVLNIQPNRIDVAQNVYVLTVLMLFVTILIAPFKAILISHENIVYISFIEVIDAILRLILALTILGLDSDKLMLYAYYMTSITIFNLIAFAAYGLKKYQECKVIGLFQRYDSQIVKQLTGFVGWTTYGMASVVCRNQGTAIILNSFYGTVINAAYGLANQVYASVSIVSTSILNAMNPQIMKAEGEGNRKRMLFLAEMESKYSEILIMILLIPLIFEMPAVLHFWLGNDTPETTMFCRFILIALMLDQWTYGLNTANQALGKIKKYTLLMYTPKLLVLPIGFILMHMGYGPVSVMVAFIAIEMLVSVMRLPYMKSMIDLDILHFIKTVCLPLIPLLVVLIITNYLMVNYIEMNYRFLLTLILSGILGCATVYLFALNDAEREIILKLKRKIWR